MSEKTITQLALDAGVETGSTENALAILKFAKAYADQQLKKPNDFIRDIAKLLGEDGLGFDGISWTVDDFKAAIDQEKRSTAIAFLEWVVKNGWSNRDSLENGRIDFADLYNSFINSL